MDRQQVGASSVSGDVRTGGGDFAGRDLLQDGSVEATLMLQVSELAAQVSHIEQLALSIKARLVDDEQSKEPGIFSRLRRVEFRVNLNSFLMFINTGSIIVLIVWLLQLIGK